MSPNRRSAVRPVDGGAASRTWGQRPARSSLAVDSGETAPDTGRKLRTRPPNPESTAKERRGSAGFAALVDGDDLVGQRGDEGLLGDLDPADHLHPLLAFLLLLEQLALAGDVTAVALGQHVLADRPDRLAGDDPRP